MSDLVAFIEARLTEDERHAHKDLILISRATPVERWTTGYGYNLPYSLLGEDGSIARLTSTAGRPLADGEDDFHQADTMLVARLVRRAERHARRALREVAAKRSIVKTHWWHGPDFCDEDRFCPLLVAMASAWSDHSDFKAEWNVVPTE